MQRVLVVGGGIGGLVAALAMAQRGIEVTLIERRPDFAVPGVGLGQPANALRVYRELGLLDAILAEGYAYDAMHVFDAGRRLIAEHRFLLGGNGLPAVCALSRATLHRILLDAAERAGVEIRCGTAIEALADTGGKVETELTGGRALTADLVAGFDGIRSTTRRHVVGDAFAPRFSGYGAWRVQAPRPDEVRGMEFLQGIGGKTGAMPLGDDLMYLFHICREPEGAWYQGEALVEGFRRRLEPYGAYVAAVRDGLGPDSGIVYGPLEPLLVPYPWFRGRVAIGGDAVHVVPPHLTQGAAIAAEDGFLLAHELASGDDPLDVRLMRWSKARYLRAAFVYSFAFRWIDDEQSVRDEAGMERARGEMAANLSARIAVSDRILDEWIVA